nr:hypothetical protein [Tanacetum cinerariifolium]
MIDHLARSLLIQGLLNEIYSLINSNDIAKELWDALERQMRGSECGEQDKKAAILYEYETFKAIEREQLLDTYLRYLQVINDLKKCGYKKENCELNYKFLNNLQPEWKQYGDVNDAMGYKKKAVVATSDLLTLVVEKIKITVLLAKAFNRKKYYAKPTNNNLRTSSASTSNKKPGYVKLEEKKEDKKVDGKKQDMSKIKKDGDEQVLLAKDQAWMKSNSDSDQEINTNMVFVANIKKVLSDSEESLSSAEETIVEVYYYTSDSESEFEYETSDYYDNYTNYGLFADNNDDQEIFHDATESASENFNENHIVSQKDHEAKVDHNDSEENDHLVDKLIKKFNQKIAKSKELRPSLYDKRVIGLGYTPMFLTHSDDSLEIEKFKRAKENKIEFTYDYENLNESYVNEKINFLDDYFQEIINSDFEKIDSPIQQTSSLKSYVPTVTLEKIIIDLKNEAVNLLERVKENLGIIESLKFESSENAISESENQSEIDCYVVEKGCDNEFKSDCSKNV